MKTRLTIAAILCLALLACGGGDFDENQDTMPVDCRARPELCR